MAANRDRRDETGIDDHDDLLARSPRRSPLQELRDFPFFHPEEEHSAPSWLARYGAALLVALALVAIVELVVLVLLLR